jgi:hypothetical protein
MVGIGNCKLTTFIDAFFTLTTRKVVPKQSRDQTSKWRRLVPKHLSELFCQCTQHLKQNYLIHPLLLRAIYPTVHRLLPLYQNLPNTLVITPLYTLNNILHLALGNLQFLLLSSSLLSQNHTIWLHAVHAARVIIPTTDRRPTPEDGGRLD